MFLQESVQTQRSPHPSACVIEVPGGEKQGNGAKAIFEKTMTKNFPKLSGRLIPHINFTLVILFYFFPSFTEM